VHDENVWAKIGMGRGSEGWDNTGQGTEGKVDENRIGEFRFRNWCWTVIW